VHWKQHQMRKLYVCVCVCVCVYLLLRLYAGAARRSSPPAARRFIPLRAEEADPLRAADVVPADNNKKIHDEFSFCSRDEVVST